MSNDLTELDKRVGRSIHHPDWCKICGDDCWGVLYGNIENEGEKYCIGCEFYKEKEE